MMKLSKKSAFTLLESSISIVTTAVVVGAAASMTVVTAKLAKSSARNMSSAAGGQVVLQRLLQDVRDADAVLSSFRPFSTTISASSTFLPLRLPSVDTAGRPLQGQADYVLYYVVNTVPTKRLYRCAIHCSSGVFDYAGAKVELLGNVETVEFKYFGYSPTATVKSLTTGEFDGQVSLNPSVAVKPTSISGASFVEARIHFKDASGSQKYFSGALLRNSVL